MPQTRTMRMRLKGTDMARNIKGVWIGLMLLAVAPLLRAGVDVGFDSQADFSKYKTYAWKEGGWIAPSQMTEINIHKAVDQELAAKGLKKTDTDPDLWVMTYASSSTDSRVDAPSFAGLPNTWTGWSVATTSRESSSGSLRVDLIDRQTNQMVWNGRASAGLGLDPNPEKTGKKVFKVVKQMFEEYPPQKKK